MEKLADDPAHEADRQKHRHDGKRGRQHRQPDFLGAFHRRLKRRLAHGNVAHDVLAHHNRVVNQQPHTQAQRHQRDHVDGEAQHVHEQKAAEDGNGQRQAGDHGRAPAVEEQKHNQYGEQRAFNQGAAHVIHRHPDLPRAIGDLRELNPGRRRLLQLIKRFAQAIHHRNRVFILRFLHRHQQGSLAVVQGQTFGCLRPVADARQLAQAHRAARTLHHDDLGKIFRALHAPLHLQHPVLVQGADAACGQVLVFVFDRCRHLLRRHAIGLQRGGLQIQIDLPGCATHHRRRTDAAHIFQAAFEHLVGPERQLHRAGCAGCGVGGDGHGPNGFGRRVKTQHARVFDFWAQQGLDPGDFFAHIFGRFAPFGLQAEFDDDYRLAFVAARGQVADAANRIHCLFNFFGDLALHDFW